MSVMLLEAEEAESELARIQISPSIIQRAAEGAYSAFHDCTPDDPLIIPGLERYRQLNRIPREALKLYGFENRNFKNVALSINPETGIAVTGAYGDAYTGKTTGTPTTKTPRGRTMQQLIKRNGELLGQLSFPFYCRASTVPLFEIIKELWIITAYFDETNGFIYTECSSPIEIDSLGNVTDYYKRCLLKPFSIRDTSDIVTEEQEAPDVKVERKGSTG